MNTNFITRYHRFIIVGLLLGVLASTFIIYVDRVNQVATLIVGEEGAIITEEPIVISETESFGVTASTTVENVTENIIASSTDITTEEATTTESVASSTEEIIVATSTASEGAGLATTSTAEVDNVSISTSIATEAATPPLELETQVTTDPTPDIIETPYFVEEPAEPSLTPEECHVVSIYKKHGFKNPGECMRDRINNLQR